ncbi:HSFY1 protein, partial [Odontophorus gujanensis]|nr:HSFY1 protein [Odontophorus gujanensis]
KMETSPSETSSVCVPNTDSAVSASGARRVRGKRAARDAALGPLHEEEASRFCGGEPPAKRRSHGLSERCSAKASDLSSCSFLRNLWEVVESDRFQSIWWGDEGEFIVIEEPFFRAEVLARRGRHKLFASESMTTFVCHLHHHGFYITEADLPSCASRARFLAEGAAFSTSSELLCYYHPYFKRLPPLLKTHALSTGVAKGRPAASSLEV